MVERESLGDEEALAHAPPTGGSPYAVASHEVPIVAELGSDVVDRLAESAKEGPKHAHEPVAKNDSDEERAASPKQFDVKYKRSAVGSGPVAASAVRKRQLDVEYSAGYRSGFTGGGGEAAYGGVLS